MFKKTMSFVFFTCIILGLGLNTFFLSKALAQEEDKVILISARIGAVIDLEDRDYYYKFSSEVEEFQSTILYEKKPRQNKSKFAGQLFMGSIGSIGVGILGAKIGASSTTEEGWFAGFEEAIIGYLIGSALGSSIGVSIIGTSGGEPGSFGSALGGSILGTGVGAGFFLISTLVVDHSGSLGYIGFTLAQSAGAALAFNAASRKREVVVPNEALLHIREGKWNLSYPKIHLEPHPLRQGEWMKTVNLVSLEF